MEKKKPQIAFLLLMEEALPPKKFSLKDLPKASKIDVVARALLALFADCTDNFDARMLVLFAKESPAILLTVEALPTKSLYDEISVAAYLRDFINTYYNDSVDLLENNFLSLRPIDNSIANFLEEFADTHKIIYLHETGQPFEQLFSLLEFKKPLLFVLGGRVDISTKHETVLESLPVEKITLGERSYLASTCISYVKFSVDKKFKPEKLPKE